MSTEADSQFDVRDGQSAEVVEFKPGNRVLEHYTLIELLGSGGMGSVYKVEEVETKQCFALKFLHKQQTNDATWKRFENEIRTANKLDHPNLIKVHESGLLPDGQPYFIMDLVHGESLSSILKRKGRLPLEKALKIFVQVGFALSYAHSNGVIHRDIKPSNIMIHSPDGDTTLGAIVKVVDFGIAKLTGHDEFNQQTLTKTGEIFGSPLYMSPEQCMGTAVDQRSDLYSLGCVMYETLTGAPPMVGDTALSTMLKHQSENALSLKEASMGIEFPEKIEHIVKTLLAKDARDRYQSAQLLTSHLVSFESASIGALGIPDGQSESKSIDVAKKRDANLDKKLAILLAVFVFCAGMTIGYAVPIKQAGNEHNVNSVRKEKPEIKQAAAEPLNENAALERRDLLNEYKLIAENPAKFSSTTKSGIRSFLFPPVSIGLMSFPGQKNILATNEIICPPNFQGINFRPEDDLRRFPNFLNRFNEDDIAFLDLYFGEDHAEFVDEKIRWVDSLIPNAVKLKGIRTLSLEYAKIRPQSFAMLDELPNLKCLWISRLNITSKVLARSKFLPNLEVLAISHMQDVGPIVQKVSKAAKIQRLIMRDSDIGINEIRQLSSCKQLTKLDLCINKNINDACIAVLPESVEELSLNDCPVTPGAIDAFKRLPKLRKLWLSYTGWTEADRKKLDATYPNIKINRK